MHAPLQRLFLSLPPLHALSGDKGVPGSALLAVMDGSSVFHSGHGDWLLLINPLNDFKGKLISPQSPEGTAVSPSSAAKIETKPLCPFCYV